jgi:hypothetical protein
VSVKGSPLVSRKNHWQVNPVPNETADGWVDVSAPTLHMPRAKALNRARMAKNQREKRMLKVIG